MTLMVSPVAVWVPSGYSGDTQASGSTKSWMLAGAGAGAAMAWS